VIERDDLSGGILLGVAQGREQRLRAKSLSLIANGSHRPGTRQRSILAARWTRDVHLDEFIAFAQPPEQAPLAARPRPCQPVPVQLAGLDTEQHGCREEAAVQDGEGVVWD
jgi:hypothetical protein